MATLVLGTIGQAVGGAIAPGGFAFLGATISGATIGGAIGGAIGSVIDSKLLGPSFTRQVEGPRISDLRVQASTEGAAIQRLYGRSRLAGQMIWASNFKEVAKTTTQTSGGGGGKGGGGGGGGGQVTTKTTEYRYFVSLAIGLCEGPIDRIGRVWADGKPLNLAQHTVRVYKGTDDQLPDSLIQSIEGSGNVPAYRGLAYVVFEDFALAGFGNRIPQLSFEVFKTVKAGGQETLENLVTAVNMIPGSGEFVYSTQKTIQDLGQGTSQSLTINNNMGDTDFMVSVDTLEDQLPACKSVALIVSWFGTDLRCAQCEIRPGVDNRDKVVLPRDWRVSGEIRANAHLTSIYDGNPAYGGTPSDHVVIEAVQELKARGFKVLFYPFILMDVEQGSSLPDPYNPSGTQPAYPWRGRITVDPAPGVTGSPDKTAAAATQTDAFFGTAQPSDFSVNGDVINYNGGADWGLRRMVLHYAHLCAAAGGVDAFLIASELRGLTTVRDSASTYPVVDHFMTLAQDVSGVLPASKISYAADWSEYFGHQPTDGSGDVFFHLDPFWSHTDVDFIGIDNYWPLSDWRDGGGHLDNLAGYESIFDLGYLESNIEGGEGYDWYYASDQDRTDQVRSAITDGTYSKDWIFRYKDISNWWLNQHFNRPGGTEDTTPTNWMPQSKPFWFTEIGCPAVDKGSNQPNVFVDPKSSESVVPHFSTGEADDLIQRRHLEAVYTYWDVSGTNNPISSVYAGPMVDMDNVYVWTWDARPFPDFPNRTNIWSDGPNWDLGHWLTGRVGQVPLSDLVKELCARVGFTDVDVSKLTGLVTGFVIDRIMSPRAAIESLMLAYQFDSVETGGAIRFVPRTLAASKTLTVDSFTERDGNDQFRIRRTRGQETELPRQVKLKYIDADDVYGQASVQAARLIGHSERISEADLGIVFDDRKAQAVADTWLMQTWVEREQIEFALPPSDMALDPGDIVNIQFGSTTERMRILEITDHGARDVRAVANDPSIYDVRLGARRVSNLDSIVIAGPPAFHFLDIPILVEENGIAAPYAAATADPWPGAVDVYQSSETEDYILNTVLSAPAVIGETLTDLLPGPTNRWDRKTVLRVQVSGGTLESRSDVAILAGANALAVETPTGNWEIIQFQTADLVATDTYDLSLLLRGVKGTDADMHANVPAGATVVLLNSSVQQLSLGLNDRLVAYNWRYGPSGQPLDEFTYGSQAKGFELIGLRPLSPVHVTAERDGADDVTISWIRRTRLGGDAWDQLDVPVAEDTELYEVDVLSSGVPVRTLTATSPTAIYTSADQLADFGMYPATLHLRVYQIGASYGRGAMREEWINV